MENQDSRIKNNKHANTSDTASGKSGNDKDHQQSEGGKMPEKETNIDITLNPDENEDEENGNSQTEGIP